MATTADVVSAITAHHAELQEALTARVAAVLTAAGKGEPCDAAAAAVGALLDTDIVPHARAEEDVLYAAATDARLRPLVTGMVFEHQTILALAAELPTTSSGAEAAGIARAIHEVFVGHVRRENELLLPALATDPEVNLVALLPEMQQIFGTYRDRAAEPRS